MSGACMLDSPSGSLARCFWLFTHQPRVGVIQSARTLSLDHLTRAFMLAMKNLVVSSMEVERHGEYICSYNVKAWLFSFRNALRAFPGVKHGVLLFGIYIIQNLFTLGKIFLRIIFLQILNKLHSFRNNPALFGKL
jgi:hypothetical protein